MGVVEVHLVGVDAHDGAGTPGIVARAAPVDQALELVATDPDEDAAPIDDGLDEPLVGPLVVAGGQVADRLEEGHREARVLEAADYAPLDGGEGVPEAAGLEEGRTVGVEVDVADRRGHAEGHEEEDGVLRGEVAMDGIDELGVGPIEPNGLWHVLEEGPGRVEGRYAAQARQTIAGVAANVGAQRVADQVVVASIVGKLVLDELDQVGQLGTNYPGVGRGNGVWGEVAPPDHHHVHRRPQPEQRVLELLHPDRPVDVVQPAGQDDFGLEPGVEARSDEAEPVPGDQQVAVRVVRIEELELGANVLPVPGAHVEGPVLGVVEVLAEGKAADVRVAVVDCGGSGCEAVELVSGLGGLGGSVVARSELTHLERGADEQQKLERAPSQARQLVTSDRYALVPSCTTKQHDFGRCLSHSCLQPLRVSFPSLARPLSLSVV